MAHLISKHKGKIFLALLFAIVIFAAFTAIARAQGGEDPCLGNPECANEKIEYSRLLDASPALTKPSTGPKNGCSMLNGLIACGIYRILDTLTDFLVIPFLALAAGIFDSAITLQAIPFSTVVFVTIGWSITRDVANMFFIFFLLWVAIATIFNFQAYSAKTLLPKLIVVALLINFSFPIGNFVIQTTNALGGIFYDAMRQYNPEQDLGIVGLVVGSPIANKVVAVSKFGAFVSAPANEYKNAQPPDPSRWQVIGENINKNCPDRPWSTITAAIVAGDIYSCAGAVLSSAWTAVWGTSDDRALQAAFTAIFWKLIITPVMIFILLVSSQFLVIPFISLAFVLVLGPLAFLFMILPATQQYYSQWWDRLIKWAFYFPAFMFFLFLSLEAGSLVLSTQITTNNPMPISMSFILMIGFLIGSILVAQQMGIAMSGTVIGLGKRAMHSTRRAAQRKAWRGVRKGVANAAKNVRVPEGVPFAGAAERALGRIQAAGSRADKERYEAKYGYMKNLPDREKARYISQMSAKDQAKALKDMGAQTRGEAINALSSADQIRMLQKMRSDRDTRGQEKLIGEATNNPEVRALVENETLTRNPQSKEYQDAVMKVLRGMDKKNLSAEFMRTSPVFEQYRKEFLKKEEVEQMLKSDRPETREHTADILRPYLQATDAVNDQQSKLTEQISHALASEGLHDVDAVRVAGEILLRDSNKAEDIQKILSDQMKAAGMDPDTIDGHIRVVMPDIIQNIEKSRSAVSQLKQDRDSIPLSESAKQYAATSPGQVIIRGATPVILDGGNRSWSTGAGGGVNVGREALGDAVREYFNDANISGFETGDINKITDTIKNHLSGLKSGGKVDTKQLAKEISRHMDKEHPGKNLDTEEMADALKKHLGFDEA